MKQEPLICTLPNYLRGFAHAITIVVIGAGGTGSVLLQHLARVNKSMIALGSKGIALTCIDDDIVTQSNIGRQLYTLSDIGRPKSVVLIERINRFYNTNWRAFPVRITDKSIINDCMPCNITITCVDNIATRKLVDGYIKKSTLSDYKETLYPYFWIDTGNAKDYGQVILSSPHTSHLPGVMEMYEDLELLEHKDTGPSCSLAEALEHQDLFINSYVALVTAQLIWDITQKEQLTWRGAFINFNKRNPVHRIPMPMVKVADGEVYIPHLNLESHE